MTTTPAPAALVPSIAEDLAVGDEVEIAGFRGRVVSFRFGSYVPGGAEVSVTVRARSGARRYRLERSCPVLASPVR